METGEGISKGRVLGLSRGEIHGLYYPTVQLLLRIHEGSRTSMDANIVDDQVPYVKWHSIYIQPPHFLPCISNYL
jgi:hypothetical protein